MPNGVMAKRMAALQMCINLHLENEIHDNLLFIGKENFKAKPEDAEVPALPDESRTDFSKATPGMIKRRQYYYKKVSAIFFCSNLLFFSVRLNNTSTS
jgi:endoribonuclease Dicer